jgi:capsular polysaccharide biosynthesis protein
MTDVLTVGSLGSVLSQRWRVVAILVFLGVCAGAAYGLLTPKSYTAKAVLRVTARPAGDDGYFQTAQFAEKLAATYPTLVAAPAVLDRTRSTLGLSDSIADLTEMVTAVNPTETSLVEISATDDTPTQAAKLADTIADNLAAYALTTEKGGSRNAVTVAKVVPAREPTSPSSPGPVLLGGLGTLVGGGLGIGAALAGDARARRRERDRASASASGPEPGAESEPIREPEWRGAEPARSLVSEHPDDGRDGPVSGGVPPGRKPDDTRDEPVDARDEPVDARDEPVDARDDAVDAPRTAPFDRRLPGSPNWEAEAARAFTPPPRPEAAARPEPARRPESPIRSQPARRPESPVRPEPADSHEPARRTEPAGSPEPPPRTEPAARSRRPAPWPPTPSDASAPATPPSFAARPSLPPRSSDPDEPVTWPPAGSRPAFPPANGSGSTEKTTRRAYRPAGSSRHPSS